jgi:hypothetical protein
MTPGNGRRLYLLYLLSYVDGAGFRDSPVSSSLMSVWVQALKVKEHSPATRASEHTRVKRPWLTVPALHYSIHQKIDLVPGHVGRGKLPVWTGIITIHLET